MKKSMRFWVIGSLVLLAVVTIGLGASGMFALEKTASEVQILVDKNLKLGQLSHEVEFLILQERRYEKNIFLNMGNQEIIKKEYLPVVESTTQELRKKINDLNSMISQDEKLSPEIKKTASALNDLFENYHSGLMKTVNQILSEGGIKPEEVNSRFAEAKKFIRDLEAHVAEISKFADVTINQTGIETRMRADSWSKILILLLVIGAVLLVVFGFFSIRLILRAEDQKVYYEQILDAIPLPITVTDLEMKWTFVNKAVEGMIGVDRASIYGHHCSEWKADICNTDKCGVAVLRKGGNSSVFQNSGNHRYYQTNVSYIQNIRNENIGHVETVTDVDDQKKLENMVSTMTRIVTQLATGANQVSDSSQSLSQGATEQAASLEQITSSMDELSSQTRQNAENSSQANELAQKTQTLAQNGLSQMEQMMASIGNIQSSSNEISKIIKVIDDIAFQTNLLALNAAVEAARAGRHGKGFAVVAQEVRNLANKSAKAAQQTSGLIEDTVKKVDTGSANAETVVDFLIGIVESIDKVANLSNEMATASSEQALGISQINQGLNQIEKVTQQNTANAEETASASAELSSTAAQLRRLVSGFESGNQDSDSKEKNERGGAQPPKRIPQKPSHQDGWEDHRPSDQKSQSLNPEDLISLDDDDFGKY